MADYLTNQERTAEYLKRFDREKTLRLLIKDSRPVILDVGANIGATVDEFKAWWPQAVVYCFEPQEECWPALEERIARYKDGRVVLNRCAAGNRRDEHVAFFTHDISSGLSGFNRINLRSLDSLQLKRVTDEDPASLERYRRSLNHERTVQLVRLDDFLTSVGIDHVNLLKIDTQGYEPEVLEGLGERLCDVDVVITELMFYDYYERSLSFSDIERYLQPSGFRLYDISHISKNPMNGRTDWVDVIYLNRRLRAGG